ncbi:pilus assembly PilX family protein [Nitrincola alkalisediminis]|uniref:pilus assembly PilX family protein n=1 Tax=Nitrincola alkalisediminis TaxID=1366656 RepID=UPI0018765037|nr:PilX N-terminal domain-containing pilus assembly protein [Nitrincola alkalisediminis]
MQRQAGVSLLTALVMLLISTVLGLSVMRSTLFQERMAGNLQERSFAFQRAEDALNDAEALILQEAKKDIHAFISSNQVINCTLVSNDCSASMPDQKEKGWVSAGSSGAEYMIQYLETRASKDLSNLTQSSTQNYGESAKIPTRYFRVTSVSGSVGDERGRVILQMMVKLQ